MAVNGNSSLPIRDTPVGSPDTPFVIPSLLGERIYIPCSKSAMRLLVTGKETSNAFAVVGTGGISAPPIGFHFHREAHDVFLCLKGNVNVWAGEKCRTMGPGDFASVSPGTIHQYQVLGPYSEFLGLIVPGGWEEFFRFIGEPWDAEHHGPLFPISDDRNPFEVLIPKLKLAAQEFDMVPQPQHPHFEPQPWAQDDNKLPGKLEPYFLRNDSGPKYLVGGTLCTPLATTAESNGRFSVGSVEGSSSFHSSSASLFANGKSIRFNTTHHCVQVVDGRMDFVVNGTKGSLTVGETLFIPAGMEFSFEFCSSLAKMYVFANGGGLVELLCKLGVAHQVPVLPVKAAAWDSSSLSRYEKELSYSLS